MNKDNFAVIVVLVFMIGLSATITNCGVRMTGDRVIEELRKPCTEQISK